MLVLEAQRLELAGAAVDLSERGAIRAGHEHDGGALGIAQGLDRGGKSRLLHLQPRVGTEARGSLGGRLQESRPDARQAEEPQRVSRRRGVEQDVVERHGRLVAARSSANSSNAAISTVHTPASCSRSSATWPLDQMGR